ncbi:MAG: hypothetical protein ABIH99_05400 [Candidatus Micrarchaeota archaeon]
MKSRQIVSQSGEQKAREFPRKTSERYLLVEKNFGFTFKFASALLSLILFFAPVKAGAGERAKSKEDATPKAQQSSREYLLELLKKHAGSDRIGRSAQLVHKSEASDLSEEKANEMLAKVEKVFEAWKTEREEKNGKEIEKVDAKYAGRVKEIVEDYVGASKEQKKSAGSKGIAVGIITALSWMMLVKYDGRDVKSIAITSAGIGLALNAALRMIAENKAEKEIEGLLLKEANIEKR